MLEGIPFYPDVLVCVVCSFQCRAALLIPLHIQFQNTLIEIPSILGCFSSTRSLIVTSVAADVFFTKHVISWNFSSFSLSSSGRRHIFLRKNITFCEKVLYFCSFFYRFLHFIRFFVPFSPSSIFPPHRNITHLYTPST